MSQQPVLEERVGKRLQTLKQTLAVAESCSGGLLAHRITNIPGASAYFLGGIVTYSNKAKQALLDVSASDLEAHGAVNERVARQMAEGVRAKFQADYGVGITGIAGPGGGSDEEPVGLVYIAVANASTTHASRHVFSGSRLDIKTQTVDHALILLQDLLP